MKVDDLRATLMIIDDEPDNLTVLGEMLRQAGWGVRAFPRGELALAAAADEPPDLILLDIRMPGMDGYEVCRRLKADARLSAVPVIFLSAFAETADKVRAFEAGGVDYVTKPFAEAEVLARTRTHLRLSRHQLHLEALVRERVGELAEAHRRLRIWDDAKTQWLDVLSHELRTPLTGVLGIAEILFMEVPAASAQGLREAYDGARTRLEKLIDDAAALAHIDVASEAFDIGPVLLEPVLRQALDAAARHAPEVAVSATLGAAEGAAVAGEAGLLERAFADLLRTAACCVGAGEPVTLQMRVLEGEARVMIATGGKSLSPEALETFFEVGGQRTLMKGGGDFGLGAALASRIIRLFNGHLSVRNGPEKGLVIEITLPAETGCALKEGQGV